MLLFVCAYYFGDDIEVDAIDKTEQIFDFLDVLSFVSLFSGLQNEPLYFVKVTEKDTAQKDHTDPYGHFIGNGERFFKGFYLKLSRSKHICKKKFQLLPTPVVFVLDEVFDTYVEITEDLYLDAQHFKLLIQKANSYMQFSSYCYIYIVSGIFHAQRLLNLTKQNFPK